MFWDVFEIEIEKIGMEITKFDNLHTNLVISIPLSCKCSKRKL